MLERYGRNRGPVDRKGCGNTAKRTKLTCVGAPWSKRGSCSSGGVWRTAKQDSTGYCSSPPSTSSSLHGLLFIHRRSLPASTCDCSSTGSCSSSLHRALLHRLLFNQPSPWGAVHPALHRLLFNPALHGFVLFIQPSTRSCSSTPNNAHCSSRGGIDRLQLATVAKESLDRVQLAAIDRSLGFSNA